MALRRGAEVRGGESGAVEEDFGWLEAQRVNGLGLVECLALPGWHATRGAPLAP